MVGLQEAHLEVVEHGRLVQVAEGGEVILPDQNIRVTQKRKLVMLGPRQLLLGRLHV